MLIAAARHRHGVRYRIVDNDVGPTDFTRTPVLWHRTQQILAELDIRDRWLADSDGMRKKILHFYGKFASGLSLSAPNSPFLKARYAGQNVTERLLDEHLSEIAMPVEFGKEMVSYADGDDAATVPIRARDGHEEVATARWVVSGEGAHSVVRRDQGLDFEGEKYVATASTSPTSTRTGRP